MKNSNLWNQTENGNKKKLNPHDKLAWLYMVKI